MLYIVDHHNSVTTAIHTTNLTPEDAHRLILGLRFFDNVYLNYASDEPLFKNDDTPSWSNQDCVIYFYQQTYMVYEDGKWKACDEPDLAPHAQWVQHEIS